MLIHIQTSLVPFLLVLCAIFAAGEAALLSLSRAQLEEIRAARPLVFRRIYRLIASPEALLSTIVISNESLNILLGTAIATSVQTLLPGGNARWGIVLSVATTSFLMLTVSEILPKVLAFRLPVLTASILVFPIGFAHKLVTPFRHVFLGLASGILRVLGIRSGAPPALSEQDFLTLVEVGAETGTLARDEKDLIFNVFQFSDRTVGSVMTPWLAVTCVDDRMTVHEVIEKIRLRVLSRIPVIARDTGIVIGVLYTKELLKLLLASHEAVGGPAVRAAILPPYVVSAHKKIATLFREFKQKKIHFALVVDEYGKPLGIVTLDDLLNALFQTRKKVAASL